MLDATAATQGVEATGARWHVGARVDRPQSTLFPLRLEADGEVVLEAYYKVHRVRPDADDAELRSKLTTFHRVLARGPELVAQFTRRKGTLPVDVPAVLATDVARLTEVQVKVAGTPLERIALRALPSRRGPARRAYRHLGAAIAVLESCTDDALADAPVPSLVPDGHLARLAGVLDAGELRRIKALVAELEKHLRDAVPLVYCHGDVSSGNLLLHDGRLGLIDPLWSMRWPGADVALYAARLEHELGQIPSWTRVLVDELLAGYGRPSLREEPVWQLLALRHAIELAGSRRRLATVRGRRAVHTIRRALQRHPA